MPTLLAHLADHLTTQKEYLATEGLGFILGESEAARGAMAFVLAGATGLDVHVAGVATQVATSAPKESEATGSRPDLALYDKADHLLAFIEGKFWAGLTDAQPVEYLKLLHDQGGKVLLFIVPEERRASLLPLLADRIEEAGLGKPTWQSVDKSNLAVFGNSTRLVVTSWTHVLEAIKHACEARDQTVLGDLLQLEGLVAQFEAGGFHPLSEEELSDLSTPRRLAVLVGLYEAAIKQAEQEGLLSTKGLRPTHGRLSSGRYVSFSVAGALVGMDLELWALHHASPLWVFFSKGDWGRATKVAQALDAWAREEPPRLFTSGQWGWTAVPLRVPAGVEEKAAVDAIVGQLKEVRDGLLAAGLPPLKGAAPPAGQE